MDIINALNQNRIIVNPEGVNRKIVVTVFDCFGKKFFSSEVLLKEPIEIGVPLSGLVKIKTL